MPIRKGNWSKDEDKWLMEAINKCNRGRDEFPWTEIAKDLPIQRTAKQCRERWMQHLNPNLDKSPLSPNETRVINNFVIQQGHQWANISRYLHHRRSDNQIKNWYYSGANRSERTNIEHTLNTRRLGRGYPSPPSPPSPTSQAFDNRTLPLPPVVQGSPGHTFHLGLPEQQYYFHSGGLPLRPQSTSEQYVTSPMYSSHQYATTSLAPPRRDLTPSISPTTPTFPHESRESSIMNVGNLLTSLSSHDRYL
jgi:hypothetical protein